MGWRFVGQSRALNTKRLPPKFGTIRPGFAPDAIGPLIFDKGRQVQFQLEPTGRIELPTCCFTKHKSIVWGYR
jgi:hypothetical protein